MKKVLILINEHNSLYNLRRELILEMLRQNYHVYLSLPYGDKVDYFVSQGCTFIDTKLKRRKTNPFSDLKLLFLYIKIIKNVKPDIILTFSIKPNIYGGIAARVSKMPYIINITGLGSALVNKSLVQKISIFLYRISTRRADTIMFQNIENMRFFQDRNIIHSEYIVLPGSGVNLEEFSLQEHEKSDNTKFTYIGRVMKEKGIELFIEMAIKIKEANPNVSFDIVGSLEEDYYEVIKRYTEDGIINYLGYQNPLTDVYKRTSAVICTSYHEGMSNVLLEAAASGRAVIASNIPGCREIVDEAVTGYLFEVGNINKLMEKVGQYINLPLQKKIEMGIQGREKISKEFNRNIIIEKYMFQISKY